MTYIVKDECIKCKLTDCVEVCPVDCFYEGPEFLVIDPDECIDCGLCEPECPIEAIFADDELPEDQIEFIEINLKLSSLHNALFLESSPGPVKYAASLLGLCNDRTRLPLSEINDDTKKEVKSCLTELQLL